MKIPLICMLSKKVSETEARSLIKKMGDPNMSKDARKLLRDQIHLVINSGNHTGMAHLANYEEGFEEFAWLDSFFMTYLEPENHFKGVQVCNIYITLFDSVLSCSTST